MAALLSLVRHQREPDYADALVRYVESEFRRRQSERRPWELQWLLNNEFLHGNQFLQINAAAATITEVPRIWWWQEREVFNQIAPIYETRVARLSRVRPAITVRPATAEVDDQGASRVAEAVLASARHRTGLDDQLVQAIAYAELHGTCWLKTAWDPRAGRTILQVRAEGSPEALERLAGQDVPPLEPPDVAAAGDVFGAAETLLDVHEGDVQVIVVPATEIYPDSPWRDDVSEIRSIIHARVYSLDEIEETWGVRVAEESVQSLGPMAVTIGPGGLGYGGGAYRIAARPMRHSAIVKEFWERPTARYPQGRLIITAGGKLLYAGPLPWRIGEAGEPDLPFVRIVSSRRPGCIWGISPIERLIPLQRRYNALRNRVAEYLNRVAVGGWYLPTTAETRPEDLDPEPGLIVTYSPKGGAKPEPIVWPGLPPEFAAEFEHLMREFTVISGVSEFARFGEGTAGARAGISLALTLEQDDTRLSVVAGAIASAVAQVGKHWLRLYKQFAREPRMVRAVGQNGLADVLTWTADQLRSDDVVVEGGQGLLDTPAQRRQMVQDLLQAGLFADPETGRISREARQKIFQMLEMGDWEDAAEDDDALNRKRARTENQLMARGIPAGVQPYFDHAAHIAEHRRFQLSLEYDRLTQGPGGEWIRALFEEHVQAHLQAQQQAAAQAAAQQGAAQTTVQAAAQAGAQAAAMRLGLPPMPVAGAEPIAASQLAQIPGGGGTVG